MRLIAPVLIVIIALTFVLPLSAQQIELLSRNYTPAFSTATIKAFLDDIELQTGISISYSNTTINTSETVKLAGNEVTIGAVLNTILLNKNIEVIPRKDKILLTPRDKESRQSKQHYVTISGYVKEAGSMESLIGATVLIPTLRTGTVTNSYGYYSLTIPEGSYIILYSYIGYQIDTLACNLSSDSRKDILLNLQNTLTEVKIARVKDNPGGHVQLTYADIKEKPVLLGETDIMRALQNQAGVSSATEGSNKVLVRGGDPGQNLNLIDGVPLYYIDHFLGLTSVFNSEAIKSVDFYKGAFPSRYGGRVSSIIDISTKDGDMERWGGQFSMGLLKGSLNLEGPVIKDKSSVMISLRRTWFDALWRLNSNNDTNKTKIDFYDVNAKANYIIDKNNRLYLSIYNGRDQIGINNIFVNNPIYTSWGNTVGALRWNRIATPKLFINTTLNYSYFRFGIQDNTIIITADSSIKNGAQYNGTSTIRDISLTSHASWYPSVFHKVEMGIHYSNAFFVPISLQANTALLSFGVNSVKPFADHFHSNEITLYAEDEIKLNNRWTLRPGFHFANWISKTFNYPSIQPRIYTSYKLADRHFIYASFTEMAQFLHLISNVTTGLPTDFWIPSSSNIEPEESYMGAIGYDGVAGKNFKYNIEVYYKDIRNVTTYSMGKNLFDNSKSWEDNIIQGDGWSYGSELSLKEKIGPFKFRLDYTLSWTWRKFAELNNGVAFPYRYDRRHNIKVAAIYKPSDLFEMSANWTFMSGEAITLPDQVYPDLDKNLLISQNNNYYSSGYTYNYVGWNNYRLPPIHRLDLAVNFTKIKGPHRQRIWSFGVYNAYMRQNVMVVTLENQSAVSGNFRLQGLSFLRFIPFVNYQLKF